MVDSSQSTIESWAEAYVTSTELEFKLRPPTPPAAFASSFEPLRILAPGRPPELRVMARRPRSKPQAQLSPTVRAELCATFLHHELQAAELMAWAILAFSDAEMEFRRGLVRIALDEIRHANLYGQYLEQRGFRIGHFPVRDWFWQRVATCQSALQFVALMGIGFEGGNLDHSARFAQAFRTAADSEGAQIHELIGREEVAHVQFAVTWFQRWTGALDYERWCQELPAPLTPAMLRGKQLDVRARHKAGITSAFLAALEQVGPARGQSPRRSELSHDQ